MATRSSRCPTGKNDREKPDPKIVIKDNPKTAIAEAYAIAKYDSETTIVTDDPETAIAEKTAIGELTGKNGFGNFWPT